MKTKLLIILSTLFVLFAFRSPQQLSIVKILNTKKWDVTSLNGQLLDKKTLQGTLPFIKFNKNGKISGSTTCNSFSGTYKVLTKGLSLNPGLTTKKPCSNDLDIKLLSSLKQVNNFKFSGSNLKLLNGSKELLNLIPGN
jgi:heat shock protein HslJ